MKRCFDTVFNGVDYVCRLLLVILTGTVLITVFGRYVLSATPRWSEELALALLVWLSLLSVALGLRGGWHLRLDLVVKNLPARPQAVTEGLNSLIAILTAGLFVWFGTRIAVLNLGSLMPGLGISAFWQYLAVPVSGVLMLAALAERAIYGRTAAE